MVISAEAVAQSKISWKELLKESVKEDDRKEDGCRIFLNGPTLLWTILIVLCATDQHGDLFANKLHNHCFYFFPAAGPSLPPLCPYERFLSRPCSALWGRLGPAAVSFLYWTIYLPFPTCVRFLAHMQSSFITVLPVCFVGSGRHIQWTSWLL